MEVFPVFEALVAPSLPHSQTFQVCISIKHCEKGYEIAQIRGGLPQILFIGGRRGAL